MTESERIAAGLPETWLEDHKRILATLDKNAPGWVFMQGGDPLIILRPPLNEVLNEQ